MSSAQDFSKTGTFDSPTFAQLTNVFDDIWVEARAALEGQSQAVVENARSVIAKALIFHAGSGHCDIPTLKAMTLRSLEQKLRRLPAA